MVNDPFGRSLIFCLKIPLGDLILKIIFENPSEFLFFRNLRKFESAVKVRFLFDKITEIRCEDEALLKP